MDVVKRNLYSILCGIVAIIAVVFVLFFVSGWFEDLQARLDDSKSTHDQITSMLSKSHMKPTVSLEKQEVEPLPYFPTPKVIAEGEKAVTRVQEQAQAVLKEAMNMNRRDPLVPGVLPRRESGAAASAFKRQYYEKLHEFRRRLNAVSPPTPDEVAQRMEQVRRQLEENMLAAGATETARQDLEIELKVKEATLHEDMARERAQKATMYVSADTDVGGGGNFGNLNAGANFLRGLKAFDVHHPGIPTPDNRDLPSDIDVWAAQLSLWVQDEVVNAIVATNEGAQTVDNAVIKRLVEIKVPKEYITRQGRMMFADSTGTGGFNLEQQLSTASTGAEDPSAVPMDDPTKAAKDEKQSPTGRISNPLYDVMHFTVTVDTDAQRFREFISKLATDRFFTVIAVDMEGVNRDLELQNMYMYGERPIVRVRLTCEALFFREWTLPLMPEPIQKILRIVKDPATGGLIAGS